MPIFDVLLDVLGAVGDIVAAGGKCTKEDSKLQGTEYEQLGSDLERSGNDFANNMRKLKRTFGDDDRKGFIKWNRQIAKQKHYWNREWITSKMMLLTGDFPI